MRAQLLVVGLIVVGSTALAAQVGQGLGPKGATAKCINGKYSMSKSRKAACQDDDGVAVWYGLAPELGAAAAPTKPDVFARLEAMIGQELPNTVLRSDKDANVTDRWVDTTKYATYASLMEYLDKEHQESACRRTSSHCVSCTIPSRRIYCTNVPQYIPLPAF